MKQITLNNYEAFLLDFAEGRLTSEEMEMLFDFIHAHPELEHELEELAIEPILKTNHIANKSKNKLYRDTQLDERANLYIACAEGIATKQELDYVNKLTAEQPAVNTELRLYRAIKFNATNESVFSRKELLMQEAPVRLMPWIYKLSGVAAVVVGIWLGIQFLPQAEPNYALHVLRLTDLPEDNLTPVNSADLNPPIPQSISTTNNDFESMDLVSLTQQEVENPNMTDVVTEEQALYMPTKHSHSLFIEQNLQAELMKLNIKPADIKYDEDNNPYFLIGMNDKQKNDVNFEPLIQKVTILIDEKVEVQKDQHAFYIRVGRFTVSFVKSIFNKNEEE